MGFLGYDIDEDEDEEEEEEEEDDMDVMGVLVPKLPIPNSSMVVVPINIARGAVSSVSSSLCDDNDNNNNCVTTSASYPILFVVVVVVDDVDNDNNDDDTEDAPKIRLPAVTGNVDTAIFDLIEIGIPSNNENENGCCF
jgi:hypothetical protein